MPYLLSSASWMVEGASSRPVPCNRAEVAASSACVFDYVRSVYSCLWPHIVRYCEDYLSDTPLLHAMGL